MADCQYAFPCSAEATYVGIESGRVVDDSVIPNCHVSSFPPPPGRSVSLLGKAVFQESKSSITLRLGDTDEPGDKPRVDKDRFQTSDRVDTDDRVDRVDGFAQGNLDSSSRARGSLVVTSVNGREGLEVDLVWSGQL